MSPIAFVVLALALIVVGAFLRAIAARPVGRPRHRHIVGALLESMEVCDATRSWEPNPYQRVFARLRERRCMRVLALSVALLLVLLGLVVKATTPATSPPAVPAITR